MFKTNSKSKKVLLSLGVLAGIGALAGAGTFASFTAQTTNPNTFANGTLVLSDIVDGGTACLSTDASTEKTDTNAGAGDCDAVFDLSVMKPGDSHTADITLQNEGSLSASDLQVFSSACSEGDAAGEFFNGTGNPCDAVQIYIQQYTSAARTTPTPLTGCLYGGSVSSAGVTCDFSDAAKTLDAFVTASAGGGLSAGTLTPTDHALNGTDTRWFRVGVKLPQITDNSYQGRAATMNLNWHLSQTAGTATP